MAPREGEEPLAASSWFRIHAIRPHTQARAHHSILLERPLTMGEMRANVFVARAPGARAVQRVDDSQSISAPTRMGVEACRPPGGEATRPLCVPELARRMCMACE